MGLLYLFAPNGFEMERLKGNLVKGSLFGLILLLTWLVYQPGLSGAFVFDDYPNIIRNKAIAIDSLGVEELRHVAFIGVAGPLKRPIAMLSFAINYHFTGFDSYWFKAVNLALHCANGIGLFFLTSLLLNTCRRTHGIRLTHPNVAFVSIVTSAAWMLHPMQLTSVLYVVQRMVELAAFFSIAGMIVYTIGRIRQLDGRRGWPWILGSLLVATPMAALSKENGALLPLLLVLIEVSFFRFRLSQGEYRWALIATHIAILLLPTIALIYVFAVNPSFVFGGYETRDFTLTERLLTESRVIWFYISQTLTPMGGHFGLYHDDFVVSRSLFDPRTTILSAASLALLATAGLVAIFRAPVLGFGILFYFVGHSMESTVLPLELVHEHRNYVPSYGLIFIIIYYVSYSARLLDSLRIRQVAAITLVGIFALITVNRANTWSDPLTHAMAEIDAHPNSPRANMDMGQYYLAAGLADKANSKVYLTAAKSHFRRASELRPRFVNGLFALLVLTSKSNETMPQGAIEDLINRLQYQPFSSNTVAWIDHIARCISKSVCDIAPPDMTKVIQAALANVTIRPATRAELLTAAANYYFAIGDYRSALYLSASASGEFPKNARYRLNLANLLILLGRTNDARYELEQAARYDRFGANSLEAKRLSALLKKSK